MKNLPYKILAVLMIAGISVTGQQFKTPVQEYKLENGKVVSIEASYTEIEIEEWSKNKVEVQGVMNIQGLNEEEAQRTFDDWVINAQENDDGIAIRSNSNNFGNEYFFIHNDKYMGNVMVDIPMITERAFASIDSANFVFPDLENFPDLEIEFDPNFQVDIGEMEFDFEAFQEDNEYLIEWQEKNKENLKRIKEEIKISQKEMAKEQKELKEEMKVKQKEAIQAQEEMRQVQIEMREAQREAQREVREAQKEMREAQMQAHREAHREARAAHDKVREYEVQRIIDKRQRIKIKRTLKIKVPKNAKLEMDVDYCKISTIN